MLDVATGSGNTALAFAPHVETIVATDLTRQMVEVCRRLARERGLANLAVAICRAEALPFGPATFDAVSSRIAPHHFDSPPHFVGEVKRVLKPGGWFLLIDNVGPTDEEAGRSLDALERRRDPSHRSYLSAELWRGMLTDYGLRIRHEEQTSKTIDIEDWLERINAPQEARRDVRERIRSASGPLRDYLEPTHNAFLLREHLFLADNPD